MSRVKNPPHLEFEAGFWFDCANTYNEERKQHVYAQHMGINRDPQWPFGYKASGRVLDIGGGPVSLLLKTTGFDYAVVQDPTSYPEWIYHRYADHGIATDETPAEQHIAGLESPRESSNGSCVGWITPAQFDEVWLYNCLQHTEDPKRILDNIADYLTPHGGIFRFFEWINIPPHEGHPHMITLDMFEPIKAMAKVKATHTGHVDVDGCFGEYVSGWAQL